MSVLVNRSTSEIGTHETTNTVCHSAMPESGTGLLCKFLGDTILYVFCEELKDLVEMLPGK